MTFLPAQRLLSVKPSPSMAAKTKVDALRAAGHAIVDFTIGEPDFDTPVHIADAGVQAIRSGKTRYTGSGGIPELRQAITRKLARENQLDYAPEQIAVGTGAKHVIYNALVATLSEGDEVLIPAPYWVSYPDMVSLADGTPVIIPCGPELGFKLTPALLAAAITPRTRWLVLNSPNNPTGSVYNRDELQALAHVLMQHPHVWVMTDEIYEHFSFGAATHHSIVAVEPALKERTLIVNGVSKAYAMTGWRIGFGAGPLALIKAITLLTTQSVSCAPQMSQIAAVAALDGPQDCVTTARELFEHRRNRMVQLLNAVPGIHCQTPDGAFYVFASVEELIGRITPEGTALRSDLDVAMFFLEAARVAVIDGSSYGLPMHLRFSFATSVEQIEVGCAAIAQAVSSLKQLSHV